MSAEKDGGIDGVFEFFKGATELEQEFDALNTRYFWYCQEVTALEQKLANGNKRRESRQARLSDLKTRLMPQLHSRLDWLQLKLGGSCC